MADHKADHKNYWQFNYIWKVKVYSSYQYCGQFLLVNSLLLPTLLYVVQRTAWKDGYKNATWWRLNLLERWSNKKAKGKRKREMQKKQGTKRIEMKRKANIHERNATSKEEIERHRWFRHITSKITRYDQNTTHPPRNQIQKFFRNVDNDEWNKITILRLTKMIQNKSSEIMKVYMRIKDC